MAQRATLETREAKHEPRSEADQRRTWRREAVGWLGGEQYVDEMVTTALRPLSPPVPGARISVTAMAEEAIETVSASRATWQVWHVRAEAESQARTLGISRDALDLVVDEVVARALDECSVQLGAVDPVSEPAALRRQDGSSMYDVAGSATYTSTRVLAAEEQILAAARRRDGRRVRPELVSAVIEQPQGRQPGLAPEQAALLRELATSGCRVQLALAPAGSGKTWAMRALAQVWTSAPWSGWRAPP